MAHRKCHHPANQSPSMPAATFRDMSSASLCHLLVWGTLHLCASVNERKAAANTHPQKESIGPNARFHTRSGISRGFVTVRRIMGISSQTHPTSVVSPTKLARLPTQTEITPIFIRASHSSRSEWVGQSKSKLLSYLPLRRSNPKKLLKTSNSRSFKLLV